MRTLIASSLFFFTLAASAQYYPNDPIYRDDRDYRREERRRERDERRREREERRRSRDYGYGNSGSYGSYGYSGDPMSIASRVLSDVRMVQSRSSVEKHDRKHFEEVDEELNKFMRKYRDGKYDRNNLKDAAESLQHLAQSDRIRDSRDRRILSDSLRAVEDLRSGRYDTQSRSRTDDRGVWDIFGR